MNSDDGTPDPIAQLPCHHTETHAAHAHGMRLRRRDHAACDDLSTLEGAVLRQLSDAPGGASARRAARAVNAWSSAAVARGRSRTEVADQLDRWAQEFGTCSPTALVRIGLRLHGASQFRFH